MSDNKLKLLLQNYWSNLAASYARIQAAPFGKVSPEKIDLRTYEFQRVMTACSEFFKRIDNENINTNPAKLEESLYVQLSNLASASEALSTFLNKNEVSSSSEDQKDKLLEAMDYLHGKISAIIPKVRGVHFESGTKSSGGKRRFSKFKKYKKSKRRTRRSRKTRRSKK
jgi:hypothetical protein